MEVAWLRSTPPILEKAATLQREFMFDFDVVNGK